MGTPTIATVVFPASSAMILLKARIDESAVSDRPWGGRALPARPARCPVVPAGLGPPTRRLADLSGRPAAGQGAQRSSLPAAPRPRGWLRALRRAGTGDRAVAETLSG